MSVWWGRCREGVVYSVPKEVEWYSVWWGTYTEFVYSVPKEGVWCSVWWGTYREGVVYSVPKEVEWYKCVVGNVYGVRV